MKNELKQLENELNFVKRNKLNYEYQENYSEDKINSLENLIRELRNNLLYEIDKKDEFIENVVKENRKLKEKLENKKINKIPKPNDEPENIAGLKLKIKNLEKVLTDLNNQIYINKTCNLNDEDGVISQIEKWKNKSEYFTKNCPIIIAELKQQIFSQNLDFENDLKSTKQNNTQILYNLEGAYQSMTSQTENEISELIREKDFLEDKMKEIKKVLKINI
jgi:hypothetical protein